MEKKMAIPGFLAQGSKLTDYAGDLALLAATMWPKLLPCQLWCQNIERGIEAFHTKIDWDLNTYSPQVCSLPSWKEEIAAVQGILLTLQWES